MAASTALLILAPVYSHRVEPCADSVRHCVFLISFWGLIELEAETSACATCTSAATVWAVIFGWDLFSLAVPFLQVMDLALGGLRSFYFGEYERRPGHLAS